MFVGVVRFCCVIMVLIATVIFSYSESVGGKDNGQRINTFRLPIDIEMTLIEIAKKEFHIGDTISIRVKFNKKNLPEERFLSDTLSNISIEYDENILLQLDSDMGGAYKKLKANLKKGSFPNRTLRFKAINCGYTNVIIGINDFFTLDATMASLSVDVKCERVMKKNSEVSDQAVIKDKPIPQKLIVY